MRKRVVTSIQKSINSCFLQLGLSEEGCDNQFLWPDVLQCRVVQKVLVLSTGKISIQSITQYWFP